MSAISKTKVGGAIGIVFIIIIAIAIGCLIFIPKFHRKSAEESLKSLTSQTTLQLFVGESIYASGLKRDPGNRLLHIGQQITGPADDPNYFSPVYGPMADFLAKPEIQAKTREIVAKNQPFLAELSKICHDMVGIQTIQTSEELDHYYRSISTIINLYCDQLALAILANDKKQAANILNESFYCLKITSYPLYFKALAKHSTALGVWLSNIYGNYINHFDLTETEIDTLCGMLQDLKGIIQSSFRTALIGECLLLYQNLLSGNSNIYWRIGRSDHYFKHLNKLPSNYWQQADHIFKFAAKILAEISDFNVYYQFQESHRVTEEASNRSSHFTQNYCELFWQLYKTELATYTQWKCAIAEMYALKYWVKYKKLPTAITDLSKVSLAKEALIDPFTGQYFSLKVNEPKNSLKILHSSYNWGPGIRLPGAVKASK